MLRSYKFDVLMRFLNFILSTGRGCHLFRWSMIKIMISPLLFYPMYNFAFEFNISISGCGKRAHIYLLWLTNGDFWRVTQLIKRHVQRRQFDRPHRKHIFRDWFNYDLGNIEFNLSCLSTFHFTQLILFFSSYLFISLLYYIKFWPCPFSLYIWCVRRFLAKNA